LRLTVLTPAETLLEVEGVKWVRVQLADGGGISIWPGHAPLLAETVAAALHYAGGFVPPQSAVEGSAVEGPVAPQSTVEGPVPSQGDAPQSNVEGPVPSVVEGNGEHTLDLEGGIVQVQRDHVTILTSGSLRHAVTSRPPGADEDEARFDRLARALLTTLGAQLEASGQGVGADQPEGPVPSQGDAPQSRVEGPVAPQSAVEGPVPSRVEGR